MFSVEKSFVELTDNYSARVPIAREIAVARGKFTVNKHIFPPSTKQQHTNQTSLISI